MPLPLPPTILLAVGGLLLVIGRGVKDIRWSGAIALAGWLAAVYLLTFSSQSVAVSNGPALAPDAWTSDGLAIGGQCLGLVFSLVFGIGAFGRSLQDDSPTERFGFLLFQTAGAMLVGAANDFISLALAFEVIQFSTYAILRLEQRAKTERRGIAPIDPVSANHESLLWLGIAASLCVWLGIALLAGVTGATQFDDVRSVLITAYDPDGGRLPIGAGSKLGLVAVGLIVAGLISRMGLIPWQSIQLTTVNAAGYWTSGCVVLGGQLAGLMALMRLCGTVWIGFTSEVIVLLIVLSGMSFVASGCLAARGLTVGEGALRRWLSAMVMLQSAWLLVGVIASASELASPENSLSAAVGQPGATSIVLFASGASLIGLSGLFLMFVHLARRDRSVEFVDDLLGLGQLAPVSALVVMMLLASLIGFPPLWGFWSQWMLLIAGFNLRAVDGASPVEPHQGVIVLLVVAMLGSLPMIAVVIRFARVMYLDDPLSRELPQGGRLPLLAGVLTATALLVFGLSPTTVLVPLSGSPTTRGTKPQERPVGKESESPTVSRGKQGAIVSRLLPAAAISEE